MFTLIYPSENVPFIPRPSAGRTEISRNCEKFPVIKENGEVIAYASREYCHSGAKPLHPVVHLHLVDRMQRLYLQKRSVKKDIQPGRWDTAVGGHVDFGENIYEALLRETREELGMTEYNPVYLQSYVFESEIEKELVNVFAAVGFFKPVPDLDEVDEGRWWTFMEVEENLGKQVFTPNFEQEFLRICNSLKALL